MQYEITLTHKGRLVNTFCFASKVYTAMKVAELRNHYTKVMHKEVINAADRLGFSVPAMGVEVSTKTYPTPIDI